MENDKSSNNGHDCTDCIHYGECYLIARGRNPKDPCDDLELEPWYGGQNDEQK